jgi:D-xylose transport system substrate-binding protein
VDKKLNYAMKILNPLLILIIFLFMAACQKSESDVSIGFLIHSLASSRWQTDTRLIQQFAKEKGVQVIVKNAEGDENVQLGQAKELIEEGVDIIIVVAANQNTAAGIIRTAHERNVPVIAYDRMIRNSDVDYLVSFQYEKVGQLMIEYAIKNKPSGNYVMLWGDASDGNALFVQAAQVLAIEPYLKNGQVHLVYKTFIEGWAKENSLFMMKRVLEFSGKKIDAVICSNDPIAAGASEALANYGYNTSEVLITGQDATIEGCKNIINGKQTMTIYKSLNGIASQAVDLAIDVATKKHKIKPSSQVFNGRRNVPAILLSPTAVDKSNIESTVIADGIFSKDELYGIPLQMN